MPGIRSPAWKFRYKREDSRAAIRNQLTQIIFGFCVVVLVLGQRLLQRVHEGLVIRIGAKQTKVLTVAIRASAAGICKVLQD